MKLPRRCCAPSNQWSGTVRLVQSQSYRRLFRKERMPRLGRMDRISEKIVFRGRTNLAS